MKHLLWLPIVLAAVLAASWSPVAQGAPQRNVVLIHGYTGWGASGYNYTVYNQMATDLRAAGYNVWQPKLPRSGSSTGDVIKNAQFIKDYVRANNLTNVVLVGHSLGGMVVEYYTRYLNSGEISGRVTLDSVINYGYDSGLACWAVPDQCKGSVWSAILAANPRADIPMLNVSNAGTTATGVVDCNYKYSAAHINYPKEKFVRDRVLAFAGSLC